MKNKMKMGGVVVPVDYLEFSIQMKKEVCEELIDNLLKILDKQLKPELDRVQFLKEMLENSIEDNIETEQYELCQVLNDLRTLLDE